MNGLTRTPHHPADAARVCLAWLSHPVTVVSLVVLVVNDHFLKTTYPGWVTGKLSDVAGLVLAPALLATVVALLVPRLPTTAAATLGLGTVGVGFTAVKISGYAAGIASAAWSVLNGPSVVRADASDLIALPALLIAYRVWSRAGRHPASHRLARLVRVLVVLPAALVGVVATSAPDYPHTTVVSDWEGRLILGQGNAYYGPDHLGTWLVSQDGGRTWDQSTDEDRDLKELVKVRQLDCVPDNPRLCYRVVPGLLQVEETTDGGTTWRTSWSVSEKARRQLAAELYPGLDDIPSYLSSQCLLVYPVADGGHVVLVANGLGGLARRAPDGTWERLVFEPYSRNPLVLPGAVVEDQTAKDRFSELPGIFALSLVIGCLAFLIATVVAAWRCGDRRQSVFVGMLFFTLPFLLIALDPSADLDLAAAASFGFAALIALGGFAAVVAGGLVTLRWALKAAGFGVLTTLLTAAPFVLWGAGVLGSFPVAVVLSAIAAVSGLAGAVRVGTRAKRPLHSPPASA